MNDTVAFSLHAKSIDGTYDRVLELGSQEITIGRDVSCDIVIKRPAISKKHACFKKSDGGYSVVDCGGSVGIVINGTKVQSADLKHGDQILLGDILILFVHNQISNLGDKNDGTMTADIPMKASPIEATEEYGEEQIKVLQDKNGTEALPRPGLSVKHPRRQKIINQQKSADLISPFARSGSARKSGPKSAYTQLRAAIHEELINKMRIRKDSLETVENEELWSKARVIADQIIFELQRDNKIPDGFSAQELLRDVLNEALGLGPIQDFLQDATIEEIMVNGPDNIFIARHGKTFKTDKSYIDEDRLETVINRIVSPIGRQINKLSPMVDARLRDGSRVNAVIAPVSRIGPILTIRKFPEKPLSPENLVQRGTMSAPMLDFFRLAVANRLNIIISGATAAGKTTFLNVLSSFIPEHERIITIEDSAELQIPLPHVISLETRASTADGTPEISIRDLVKNALRMRPQRIIVGECRGGEAIDMLQAMNTGHDGSLTTGHANGARDMLSRIETMCLASGLDVPLAAIREQVSRAIDMIIHIERYPDGKRRVSSVMELLSLDEGEYELKEIYRFDCTSIEEGVVSGRFISCGYMPSFVARLQTMGIDIPVEIFKNG